MIEHRLTKRVPYQHEIKFHYPSVMVGQAHNLGAGGIGVEMESCLEVDQRVELEIFPKTAVASGKVRWVRPMGNQWMVGIQFRPDDWLVVEYVLSRVIGPTE